MNHNYTVAAGQCSFNDGIARIKLRSDPLQSVCVMSRPGSVRVRAAVGGTNIVSYGDQKVGSNFTITR